MAVRVASRDVSRDVMQAQRLRMQRMRWGFLHQAAMVIVALALAAAELVPLARAIEYILALAAINLAFVVLLKSKLNLRMRDPSMTAAQIITPVWPTLYIMYFVSEPQGRVAFLLMATGGLLFGMLALDRRGMFMVGSVIVLAYLMLLAALFAWAPERIALRVEAVVVFAYVAVLLTIIYLGSFVSGLRASLRARNRALEEAMAQLEDLATRDPLTRLPNRRSIMDQLAREASRVDRGARGDSALCVAILDVDLFKRINDIHGHQIGDAVLSRIGQALQSVTREGDVIGRYGGEEFLLVLPQIDIEGAFRAAERIREIIEELELPELPELERVTVSQGVAMHRPGEDIDATLKRADDALYRAKSAGRNRIVIAED